MEESIGFCDVEPISKAQLEVRVEKLELRKQRQKEIENSVSGEVVWLTAK